VFNDDFNQYYHNEYQCWSGPWELWLRDPAALYTCTGDATDNWPYIRRNNYPTTIASDRAWRPGFLTTKVYCDDEAAMFIIEMSKQEGSPDAEPEDWTDILIEIDVHVVENTTFGIMWGVDVNDDTKTPTMYKVPTSANIVVFGPWQPGNPNPTYPNTEEEMVGDRGGYYSAYKITSGIPLASKFDTDLWQVEIPPTKIDPANPSTPALTYMRADRVYVFRLTTIAEQLTLKYQIRYAPTLGVAPVYYGCESLADTDGICTEAAMNDCWCEITNTGAMIVDRVGDAGAVGLYISGSPGASCAAKTDPQAQQSFDNVKIYSFRPIPPPPTPTRTPTLQQ